jgi:hypothetical protein
MAKIEKRTLKREDAERRETDDFNQDKTELFSSAG